MITKKLLCLLLSAITVISLVSCVGRENDSPSTSEDTSKEDTSMRDFNYVPDGDFNYAEWIAPIWASDTVYDEHVMFLGTDDVVPLLFPATEIISVKSTDGSKIFTENVDYKLVDGKLVMPEGSSLTHIPTEVYWAKGSYDVYTLKDGESHITYAAGLDGMAKYQVMVSYKHDVTWPEEIKIPDCSETFKAFIKKLENGEDVTVIFNGDSITEGWDSSVRSGFGNKNPHWPALMTQYLAYAYGYTVRYAHFSLDGVFNYPRMRDVYVTRGTITYINTGVGGWTVSDSFSKLDAYALKPAEKYGCDLYFYAYGMNNSGTDPYDFKFAVKKTITKLHETLPNVPIVLVSSMLPNNESVGGMGYVPKQEAKLIEIRDELKKEGYAIEVAPMTSVHSHMCSIKRFRDHSGNNMNHPGDYLHRVYAQVALQTILGYADNYK